jgi:hypothetical protein
MRFSTKVFVLTFLPTTLLLLGGFWTLQTLVTARVKNQLGGSLRQTHLFVAELRENYELLSGGLVATVAENSALKAGFDLVQIEENSPMARLTLEDQLLVTATELGFDIIAATNADAEPITGSIRINGKLTALSPARLLDLEPGVVSLNGKTFFVNSTAVNLGPEFLGTIIVGREFTLSQFARCFDAA